VGKNDENDAVTLPGLFKIFKALGDAAMIKISQLSWSGRIVYYSLLDDAHVRSLLQMIIKHISPHILRPKGS